MRCFGRQCRGHGHVFVKLVRQTAQALLELGEPITALGPPAQPLLDQATARSDSTRERFAAVFTAAMRSHAHIRQPSTWLTQGKNLRHCHLVNPYDLTLAPMLQGKSNCPAQFGRTPGMVSDPATGFLFATQVPAGNPRDSSAVLPLLAKVQRAIARAKTPPRLRVHAVAGDLGLTDKTRRPALHARGLLPVGIPKTSAPIQAHPRPAAGRALLHEAGVPRPRTPHHVRLAGACGDSRPVVASHLARVLSRGAGHVRDTGHPGAVRQLGLTAMAHHGAVVVRIRQQRLSKRAHQFRRWLGLRHRKINEINSLKN
jgi:hypothetical protein